MAASYPTSIWNGDSENRTMALGQNKAPDWRDWRRMIDELAAAQLRVDQNNAGRDSITIHAPGTIATKTGLSLVEKGSGAVHKTIFTMATMAMVSTDGTTAGTDGAWGSQLLYTFPVGHINILGAHLVHPLGGLIAVTGGGGGWADDADFEIGAGTVASAQAAGWGLGNGTQENIVAALDVDLTSKTSDAIESGANGTAATYDGSTTAVKAYLNFRELAELDHGVAADVLNVNGTLTILWSNLGDD